MRHLNVTFKIHVADDDDRDSRLKSGFIFTLINNLGAITLDGFDETIHDVEIKDLNNGEILIGEKDGKFINKFVYPTINGDEK